MNIVLLHGVLTREPDLRSLPSGDHVASFDITVRDDGFDTDVVPVSWHDAPATALDKLEVGGEVISRTEVVATAVVPTRQSRGARKAIDAALSTGEQWVAG